MNAANASIGSSSYDQPNFTRSSNIQDNNIIANQQSIKLDIELKDDLVNFITVKQQENESLGVV